MSFLRNPIASWLLTHAYGQGGTVAVPYTEAATGIPRGPFPAGVSDVLNYIVLNYKNSAENSNIVDWCFLVGGPGNGKSEALRALAELVAFALPNKIAGAPVPRAVPQNWESQPHVLPSGYGLAFINDASIPRTDCDPVDGPGSLFLDLRSGIQPLKSEKDRLGLLVNVNRGILVEEANILRGSKTPDETIQGRAACGILNWIADPPESVGTVVNGPDLILETIVGITPRAPYYGQLKVSVGSEKNKRELRIHVLFLDTLSMLEPTPSASGVSINLNPKVPVPSQYHTLGSLLAKEITRDETSAGVFLKTVVGTNNWSDGGCRDVATGQLCEAFPTCPFAQNAKWLQTESLRHRFLDALRGAEVAGAKRFTYRELLEHFSLSILGRAESAWLSDTHPCEWVKERVRSSSKEGYFSLASHRIYLNVFAGSDSSLGKKLEPFTAGDTVYGPLFRLLRAVGSSARPLGFEKAFGAIDPAKDTHPWDGARIKVLDAIESLDVVSPSEQALAWPQLPTEVHSEIEQNLDRVLREEISSELVRGSRPSAIRIRVLRRWRSMSLLRQIGLAQGRFAFGEAIQGWLAEQESALRNGPPSSLGDGIYRLIMPASQNTKIYLAPLRPRTYCLTGKLPTNTILTSVSSSDLRVVIVPYGDALLAEVKVTQNRDLHAPTSLATLAIDLSIAREALLHSKELSESFTEIGHTAFARIERARASLISRARSFTSTVYFTDNLERLFTLTPSPVGGAALRVQPVN